MTAEAKKSNSFMSMFVPGLIVGLLVGAVAGAFLPPILERKGIGLSDAPVSGPVKDPKAPAAPRERDPEPGSTQPTADAPQATDPAKVDPATDPKTEPKVEPKPADPATTPK